MVALSPCSAEPAFSAAALFAICTTTNFPFGSRQGIQIGRTDSLVPMIRYFNPWKPSSRRAVSRGCACRRLRRYKCGQSLHRERTGDFPFRSRRGRPTGSSSSAPGRSRTAYSRLWDRRQFRVTIPVYPEARRRRTGRPGCIRRCTFHPARGDVRTGRRVSHDYPQASSPASNRSDVRPRPDQIATGLRGRCCGRGCSSHAASRDAFNDLRARRPSRLLLRAISQSPCARSCPRAPTSSTVCHLACNGMGL